MSFLVFLGFCFGDILSLTFHEQYAPKLTIKVNVGGEIVEEEGQLFTEATFIS